jgi:hypothetical protein
MAQQAPARYHYFIAGLFFTGLTAILGTAIGLLGFVGFGLIIAIVIAAIPFVVAIQCFGWAITGGPRNSHVKAFASNIFGIIIDALSAGW